MVDTYIKYMYLRHQIVKGMQELGRAFNCYFEMAIEWASDVE